MQNIPLSLYSYVGKLLYTIDSVVHRYDLDEVEKATKSLSNPTIENQLKSFIKQGQKEVSKHLVAKGCQSIVVNILIGKINIDLKICEIMDKEGKDSALFLVFKLKEVDTILSYLHTPNYDNAISNLLKLGHLYILWATRAHILKKLSKDPHSEQFSGVKREAHLKTALMYAERASEILKHKQFLLSSDLVMLGYSILIPFYLDNQKDEKVLELLQSLKIMSQKYPKVKPFHTLKETLSKYPKYPSFFLNQAPQPQPTMNPMAQQMAPQQLTPQPGMLPQFPSQTLPFQQPTFPGLGAQNPLQAPPQQMPDQSKMHAPTYPAWQQQMPQAYQQQPAMPSTDSTNPANNSTTTTTTTSADKPFDIDLDEQFSLFEEPIS